jgi:hypothetical protein
MFAGVVSTDEFKCFQNVLQANRHGVFVARPVGSVNVLTRVARRQLTELHRSKGTEGSNPFPTSAESAANLSGMRPRPPRRRTT